MAQAKIGKERENALEMVKRDWVKAEIRKMVEGLSERGSDWNDGVDRKQIIIAVRNCGDQI